MAGTAAETETEAVTQEFSLRDEDGTLLSIVQTTPTGEYTFDEGSGWRQPIETKQTTPLKVKKKLVMGERIDTELGRFEAIQPRSPEYTKRWPDSVFVKRVTVEQSGDKV